MNLWERNYLPHKHACEVPAEFSIRCAPLLLQDVIPHEHVLFLNQDFICLNKPPDLRMDGDFDVTLEKLLQKWLPEHYNMPRAEPKWIHQLDFSTSGSLLVGLHRAAANAGSSAFAERSTYKEYLAMVEGRLEPEMYPVLDAKLQEPKPKRTKALKRRIGDAAVSWQDRAIRSNLDSYVSILRELCLKDPEDVAVDRWLQTDYEQLVVNNKLRKELRKFLKSKGAHLTEAAIPAPHEPIGEADVVDKEKTPPPPTVAEDVCEEPVAMLYRLPAMPSRCFYINVPIAEVKGTFYMEAGHAGNPGQWSETLVEVVDYARYQGREVTKLRLTPQTGRRHQLRIHCRFLGHPIVGDATYCSAELEAVCSSAQRMMLHAHLLRVPVQGAEGLLETTEAMELLSPDPFVVDTGSADGSLRVQVPSFVEARSIRE